MERRWLLASLGIGGISTVGAVGVFKPEILIGNPRGKGDPISTERTVSGEMIEYQSSNNTVRYPTTTNPDDPEDYETTPFEDWAKQKCASIGADTAITAIRRQFDEDPEGIGKAVSDEYIGSVILIRAITRQNREGKVVSQPSISFEKLVRSTPRTVRTTVRLEGQEYTRGVPVFVEQTTVTAA